MAEMTEREFAAAKARAEDRLRAGVAVSARYDEAAKRVVVELDSGVQVAIPAASIEGLAEGTHADLSEIEISPSGLGLYWPRLDADVYVPALLQGLVGSKAWMARQLGAVGGRARTPSKTESARANGRKGGRPPKAAAG